MQCEGSAAECHDLFKQWSKTLYTNGEAVTYELTSLLALPDLRRIDGFEDSYKKMLRQYANDGSLFLPNFKSVSIKRDLIRDYSEPQSVHHETLFDFPSSLVAPPSSETVTEGEEGRGKVYVQDSSGGKAVLVDSSEQLFPIVKCE
jgi:hypothetical protein